QVLSDLIASERGIGPHGDGKTEPARLRAASGFGQDKKFFHPGKTLAQRTEIGAARFYETIQLFELSHPDSGLHIGELEVVAQVRVRILVVVAGGQRAQLPVEAFAAAIVATGV